MTRAQVLDRPGLLLGALNLALGVALIWGGPLRTSSPSFDIAKQIMTPAQWGLLFLAGGIVCVLAAGLGRIGAVLVGAGAGIHFFWALALVRSAVDDSRAALTGCVVYAWLSGVHIWTAWRLARRVA